jgi:hypothetical protein
MFKGGKWMSLPEGLRPEGDKKVLLLDSKAY